MAGMGFHKLKPSETVFLRATPSKRDSGDDDVGSANNKPQDTSAGTPPVLVSSKSQKKQFFEGDEVVINLKLGHYYFVYPMQWAIKLNNGTSLHIGNILLTSDVNLSKKAFCE